MPARDGNSLLFHPGGQLKIDFKKSMYRLVFVCGGLLRLDLTQRHNVFPLALWLRPFHPVRMVGSRHHSHRPLTKRRWLPTRLLGYPFPAEAGPALSPQVSRATFLGALNLLTGRSGWSSQMSPAGRFTHPGVTGLSSRSRVAIGSALPALSLFPHSVELM